jgi:hypothetical protein
MGGLDMAAVQARLQHEFAIRARSSLLRFLPSFRPPACRAASPYRLHLLLTSLFLASIIRRRTMRVFAEQDPHKNPLPTAEELQGELAFLLTSPSHLTTLLASVYTDYSFQPLACLFIVSGDFDALIEGAFSLLDAALSARRVPSQQLTRVISLLQSHLQLER